MHDIAFIRANPAEFDAGLAKRGLERIASKIIEADKVKRELITKLEVARAEKKRQSAFYGQLASQGQSFSEEAMGYKLASAEQSNLIFTFEKELAELSDIDELLLTLPNLPADDVPEGADETANVEIARWGTPRSFDFAPREHADLGPPLGLDFETGAAIAGARFTFLRGGMARLHRALGQFMLDKQTGEAGYTECNPPVLAWDKSLQGTGQLPKFKGDLFPVETRFSRLSGDLDFKRRAMKPLRASHALFSDLEVQITNLMATQTAAGRDTSFLTPIANKLAREFSSIEPLMEEIIGDFTHVESKLAELEQSGRAHRHFLIPTAEVSLTNSVREQILDETQLPMRLTALTPCFRSEAGSAGRDTRGFIRQHQFEKVELVAIVRPEDSEAEHERMTLAAEAILQALELPYRKMLLCAGDMGASARKTYDLEVWLPGQGAYREISSCSNTGDWQARRMNARYRPANETGGGEKKTRFVHTLNGSGLAVGRTLVAVLENYQQADGTVTVPPVLAPYMGGVERLEPL